MTALTRWHAGPWTTRGTAAGAAFEPGRKRTPDELNFDIIGLSRIVGRRQTLPEEMLVRRCQAALRPTDPRVCGVQTLDPELSGELAAVAEQAFTWLAERAPAGYEFVHADAVELQPLLDLSADVIAVDAVVQLADVPLPAARLATSHVRRAPTGAWYAGDAVCNWSGPHATSAEAVAAVRQARTELTEQLRSAGHADLAATAPRWPDVPLELEPFR
ncbi:hypothetical protein JOF29_001774 [Kribbella aluminosa]|uniref:Uncharacterized protein n=1 Tax=Kribbella aluminosa TaxID=416017 RepID=A0ABS4UGB0_9ACTN|nr:hypothetical protein [Kribbella aluminosa]MBP2350691.1 hypothetical protein [Kribbella aluminosa]